MRKMITLFFMLLVLSKLTLKPTFAQSFSLTISPPILEVVIKPGKRITQAYKISNQGETTGIVARILPYPPDNTPQTESPDWIKLENSGITLNEPFLMPQGSEKQLILSIAPPQNLEAKDYYYTLLISSVNPVSAQSTSAQVAASVGSVILITSSKTGILDRTIELKSISVPKILDSFSPLSIDLLLRNNGRNFIRPNGTITLSGPIGKATYSTTPRIVLTNDTKRLLTESSKETSPEKTLYIPGFYLGRYTIAIKITASETDEKPIIVEKVFYAFPWKLIVIAITTVILFQLLKMKKPARKSHPETKS